LGSIFAYQASNFIIAIKFTTVIEMESNFATQIANYSDSESSYMTYLNKFWISRPLGGDLDPMKKNIFL
jgi:hypothetical protein